MSFKSCALTNLIIKLKRRFHLNFTKNSVAGHSRHASNKNKSSKEIHEGWLSELFKVSMGWSLLLFIALLRFFSWLPLSSKTNSQEHVQASSSDLLSVLWRAKKIQNVTYLIQEPITFNIVVAFQTDRGIISSYARPICCSCFIPCR